MKQKHKDWRSLAFALVVPCLLMFTAGALAAGCSTTSCSGSPSEVAHCQTSSGTQSCPSTHSSCTAQNCAGGCTGSFFLALGSAESNNNYATVNAQGCAGQWQFCQGAMSTYGLKYCQSEQNYLANVNNCQDQAAVAYQEGNLSEMQSMGVTSAIGQSININGTSYTITEAGLLGAAQLGGPGCAKSLIQGGGGSVDAGGTSCRQYFINFNNTDLPAGFPGAGGSSGGGTTAASGCGGANPSGGGGSVGSTSMTTSPDSGMSSLLPMMMMSSMMGPMMSAMSGLGGSASGLSSGANSASTGSSTGSSINNLVSSLGTSLSGGSTPAASTTTTPAVTSPAATTTAPVSQDLDQLEQQATQTEDAQPASTRDYRLTCGANSANPTVAACRNYIPAGQ